MTDQLARIPSMPKLVYLLSGAPGVGKTSLMKEGVSRLGSRAGGFYTEEIRVGGQRQGFRIVTLAGETATLAHVDFKSPYRVSRYAVDTESLDRVGVAALLNAIERCQVVVIDEIGKMELFSAAFKQAVLAALASGKKVLGTIMLASHPFADEIKRRPEVRMLVLTHDNRRKVLAEIQDWLGH